MAEKPNITVKQARQLLRYDENTGTLIWRMRTPDMFQSDYRSADAQCRRWNAMYAETTAGTLRKGYLRIRVGKYRLHAHCIIWLMLKGEWPTDQIDHENGIRAANGENNLREATSAQNAQNRKKRKTNRSGYTGVSADGSKWRAEICVRGCRYYLGSFSRKKDARAAYLAAKKIHHEFQPIPRKDA